MKRTVTLTSPVKYAAINIRPQLSRARKAGFPGVAMGGLTHKTSPGAGGGVRSQYVKAQVTHSITVRCGGFHLQRM